MRHLRFISSRLLHLVLSRLSHLNHGWSAVGVTKISSMVCNETILLIHSFPIVIEFPCLLLFDVEVVVSLLDIVSVLLLYNFATLVVQHTFLSDPVHSSSVFVRLLLLRNLS